jgi:hypothetical protein
MARRFDQHAPKSLNAPGRGHGRNGNISPASRFNARIRTSVDGSGERWDKALPEWLMNDVNGLFNSKEDSWFRTTGKAKISPAGSDLS